MTQKLPQSISHLFAYLAIYILGVLLTHSPVHAQQSAQLSQYLLNPVVLNPAIAGAEEYMDVTAAYRRQWAGLSGAPTTATITFNAPMDALFNGAAAQTDVSHAGVGALVYTDQAGPIQRSGYYINYAYHLKVAPRWFVALGGFVGSTQFRFDDSDVFFVQTDDDPLIQSVSSSDFDMSFGTFIYSDQFFIGLAAQQIFNKELPLITTGGTIATGTINTNYNLLVGGRLSLSDQWQLIPSALLKNEKNTPVQWDLNTKAIYNDRFWVGTSYRNEESVYLLAGVQFWDAFSVSYSYDFPFSTLSGYQSGSHEIVLSYRFFGNYKEKCHCPRYAM